MERFHQQLEILKMVCSIAESLDVLESCVETTQDTDGKALAFVIHGPRPRVRRALPSNASSGV